MTRETLLRELIYYEEYLKRNKSFLTEIAITQIELEIIKLKKQLLHKKPSCATPFVMIQFKSRQLGIITVKELTFLEMALDDWALEYADKDDYKECQELLKDLKYFISEVTK